MRAFIWSTVVFTLRLMACSLATLLGFNLLFTSNAYADGTFRWQNENTGWYLEVWSSSLADGGRVITYPYNGSSANQLWSDFQQSDGYYAIMNNNSGKILDRYDGWPQETAGKPCGLPYQWTWGGNTWQRWKYRAVWGPSYPPEYNREYSLWINKAGCQGDPYHDVLGTSLYRTLDTYLYRESDCSDMRYGVPTHCYWKRNGQ